MACCKSPTEFFWHSSLNESRTATFGSPSRAFLFTISAWGRLPSWLRDLWQRSSKQLDHARETERVGNYVAKSLVESKTEELLQGRGSKDIMSLLGECPKSVVANNSALTLLFSAIQCIRE